MSDAVWHAVDDAGNRPASGAMSDQDHLAQLLILQDVHQILDKGIERDIRREQMLALTELGLGRRKNAVASGAQPIGHGVKEPTSAPRAVDQDVSLAAPALTLCACAPAARAATAKDATAPACRNARRTVLLAIVPSRGA